MTLRVHGSSGLIDLCVVRERIWMSTVRLYWVDVFTLTAGSGLTNAWQNVLSRTSEQMSPLHVHSHHARYAVYVAMHILLELIAETHSRNT